MHMLLARAHPIRASRYVAAAAILAIATLGLGACGGGDDETTTTTTGVQQLFEEALRENLVGQQNMSEEVADCVIERIRETVSEEDFEEVAGGEVPQAITEAAFDAGFECASEAESTNGG
jgi:hypothetical protein